MEHKASMTFLNTPLPYKSALTSIHHETSVRQPHFIESSNEKINQGGYSDYDNIALGAKLDDLGEMNTHEWPEGSYPKTYRSMSGQKFHVAVLQKDSEYLLLNKIPPHELISQPGDYRVTNSNELMQHEATRARGGVEPYREVKDAQGKKTIQYVDDMTEPKSNQYYNVGPDGNATSGWIPMPSQQSAPPAAAPSTQATLQTYYHGVNNTEYHYQPAYNNSAYEYKVWGYGNSWHAQLPEGLLPEHLSIDRHEGAFSLSQYGSAAQINLITSRLADVELDHSSTSSSSEEEDAGLSLTAKNLLKQQRAHVRAALPRDARDTILRLTDPTRRKDRIDINRSNAAEKAVRLLKKRNITLNSTAEYAIDQYFQLMREGFREIASESASAISEKSSFHQSKAPEAGQAKRATIPPAVPRQQFQTSDGKSYVYEDVPYENDQTKVTRYYALIDNQGKQGDWSTENPQNISTQTQTFAQQTTHNSIGRNIGSGRVRIDQMATIDPAVLAAAQRENSTLVDLMHEFNEKPGSFKDRGAETYFKGSEAVLGKTLSKYISNLKLGKSIKGHDINLSIPAQPNTQVQVQPSTDHLHRDNNDWQWDNQKNAFVFWNQEHEKFFWEGENKDANTQPVLQDKLHIISFPKAQSETTVISNTNEVNTHLAKMMTDYKNFAGAWKEKMSHPFTSGELTIVGDTIRTHMRRIANGGKIPTYDELLRRAQAYGSRQTNAARQQEGTESLAGSINPQYYETFSHGTEQEQTSEVTPAWQWHARERTYVRYDQQQQAWLTQPDLQGNVRTVSQPPES
jgi:hypothetical protein